MNLNETTFPFFSLSTIVATLKHLDFPAKSGFVYLAFEICLPFRSVILNFEYSRKQRKTLKTLCFQGLSGGLGERIRTSGLLNPIGRGFAPSQERPSQSCFYASKRPDCRNSTFAPTNLFTPQSKIVYPASK